MALAHLIVVDCTWPSPVQLSVCDNTELRHLMKIALLFKPSSTFDQTFEQQHITDFTAAQASLGAALRLYPIATGCLHEDPITGQMSMQPGKGSVCFSFSRSTDTFSALSRASVLPSWGFPADPPMRGAVFAAHYVALADGGCVISVAMHHQVCKVDD
jgi:hypothetical protein